MDRNERRYRSKKKQSQREKKWNNAGWNIEDESHKGQLRKNHFGCGCMLCKPWKHGIGEELKHSELRSIIEDEQD